MASKKTKVRRGGPKVIYVLDLVDATHHDQQLNDWYWDLPSIKKLVVIYDSLINDLLVKVSAYVQDERKVREIISALANPQPDNAGFVLLKQTQLDTIHIRSDKDLDAFLRLTDAKPIKLFIILHRLMQDGPKNC